MLPKIKRKFVSFLLEEKGTISKDKLLKGAIILSGIGITAKEISAQSGSSYTQTPKSDDMHGWNDEKGSKLRTPAECQPGQKIGPLSEHILDGGREVAGEATLPGEGFSLGTKCESTDMDGDIPEVRVTTYASGVGVGGGCTLGIGGGSAIHKSVDRSWHTNSLNLKRNDEIRGLEAVHSHHGKHHNADQVKCSNGDTGPNCIKQFCMENIFGPLMNMLGGFR